MDTIKNGRSLAPAAALSIILSRLVPTPKTKLQSTLLAVFIGAVWGIIFGCVVIQGLELYYGGEITTVAKITFTFMPALFGSLLGAAWAD